MKQLHVYSGTSGKMVFGQAAIQLFILPLRRCFTSQIPLGLSSSSFSSSDYNLAEQSFSFALERFLLDWMSLCFLFYINRDRQNDKTNNGKVYAYFTFNMMAIEIEYTQNAHVAAVDITTQPKQGRQAGRPCQ